MSDIVRGAALPSGERPPVYDVIAPAIGEQYDLTFLGEYVLGTACHWVIDPVTKKGRSRLCYKHEGGCLHCGIHRNLWMGWLAVYEHMRKRRAVLRMGAESAKGLAVTLPKKANPRGKRYEVYRSKSGATAALCYSLSQHDPLTPLIAAHDVIPTVCMVLECESLPDYTYTAADIREMPQ